MTYEDFYGKTLPRLQKTETLLLDRIQAYADEAGLESELKPIVYYCSRIKSPQSVLKKCRLRGFDAGLQAALENLHDLVGVRIICAFSADVYRMAEWLKTQSDIEIAQEKDYYAAPKPNGYRSYHFLLRIPSTGMKAEIQLRTIATDFWATLEHQIKYKKEIPNEKMIRKELKRCADEIASVDLSMQTIREIIEESTAPDV